MVSAKSKMRTTKIFPLQIEEDLHKALKHKAIESDMTLHAYITRVLSLRVSEDRRAYNSDSTAGQEQEKD